MIVEMDKKRREAVMKRARVEEVKVAANEAVRPNKTSKDKVKMHHTMRK